MKIEDIQIEETELDNYIIIIVSHPEAEGMSFKLRGSEVKNDVYKIETIDEDIKKKFNEEEFMRVAEDMNINIEELKL